MIEIITPMDYPAPFEICERPDWTNEKILSDNCPIVALLESINIAHTLTCDHLFPVATVKVTMTDEAYVLFKMAGGDELVRREDF